MGTSWGGLARFTIITATYNAARTLRETLASVASQSITVEHLLIDGGSTDDTLAIARRYGKHLAKVVSEPDQGMYDAMNKGIAMASGEVVGMLNADDRYAGPDVLEKVAGVFADPDVEACYGDLVYFRDGKDGKKRIVRYWKAGQYHSRRFYWGWMPPHPTFFVRRSVYERFGGFRLEFGTAADYELMLRFLLKHPIRVAYIPEVLVEMRVGGRSNASLGARLEAHRNDRLAWKVNGLRPYPWTLACKPLRKVPQWVVRGSAGAGVRGSEGAGEQGSRGARERGEG